MTTTVSLWETLLCITLHPIQPISGVLSEAELFHILIDRITWITASTNVK